jgi:hypothetical protein
MAVLSVTTIDRNGEDLVTLSIAAGTIATVGDSFPNTGRELFFVQNGSTVALTVTEVLGVGGTVDTLAPSPRTVTIAAGKGKLMGPYPTQWYNDANGRMNFHYSSPTTVTVLPIVSTRT